MNGAAQAGLEAEDLIARMTAELAEVFALIERGAEDGPPPVLQMSETVQQSTLAH